MNTSTQREKFPIVTLYIKKYKDIEEMIKKYKYHYVAFQIRSPKIYVDWSLYPKNMEMKFFQFDGQRTKNEMTKTMEKEGFSHGSIEHLIAIKNHLTPFQKKYKILALNTHWEAGFFLELYPFIHGDTKSLDVMGIIIDQTTWPEDTLFLGVRKSK